MKFVGALYSVHCSRKAITDTHRSEIHSSLLISGSFISMFSPFLDPYTKEERFYIYLGYLTSRGCYIITITVTLGPRYGISLSFSRILYLIVKSIEAVLTDPFHPLASIMVSMICILLTDLAECFWLKIGLGSNVQSELPPEVVREIVNRLHTFQDFVAAAGVSRTWRSVCLSISRRPQLPCLMLSETLSTDMRHFFSLCDNNRYQLLLSEVQGKRCWGSPHGWIVTLGPDYETHLLHLTKRVQIALPPLNTIRTLAATEEWFRLVHKFILLNDPSQESSLLVIAIFGPVNRLAFARVAFDRGGEGAALNRRGQGQWAIVTNPDILKFNDVACFNDQLYGLCDNGKLVCLEFDAPLAAEVQVIALQPSEEEVGMPQKLYLMNSSENLFVMRHETICFLVYKFNFGALAWEEVTDLEDLAVFVGDGNSWCIHTSAISNCIYFTDDNWEWQRHPGVACGGRDVGVFSMARRLPWLMLSETLSTDMRHFFSLYYNNRYQLRLPQVHEKRYWGSPHGWVVTLGPDYETHLLHLMKRVQIPLPPLNTIRTLAPIEEWFRLVHKFILFKDPSQDSSLLVIAIFGPVNRLAFARVAFDRGGGGAFLNRRGQGQWAIVTNPDNLKFNDVACFNDQIYGLCDNGKLVRFELDAPLAAELQVIAPQPSEEEVGMPQKLYLVETSENLYGIFRYGFHIPSKMRHETIYFLVYKLNFGALAWEEVTDLEDIAVFVGEGNSWCIPTSTILCRSNCIYFTDDNWEWQRYPGVAYGGHDVGVFNMAQRLLQNLSISCSGFELIDYLGFFFGYIKRKREKKKKKKKKKKK
ncbi:putative f-box protein [Quercus suber]|uniref:F-box protein n=1 Tax=Quercus suber TaxID=58331 RepID=A0AAW0LD93_QUESU